MMTGALLYRTLETMVRESKETKVPEPEFKPFRFPEEEAVATPIRSITPANVTREPRTLEELGVPRTLAHDLEATLRVMGATRGRSGGGLHLPRGGRFLVRALHVWRGRPERGGPRRLTSPARDAPVVVLGADGVERWRPDGRASRSSSAPRLRVPAMPPHVSGPEPRAP